MSSDEESATGGNAPGTPPPISKNPNDRDPSWDVHNDAQGGQSSLNRSISIGIGMFVVGAIFGRCCFSRLQRRSLLHQQSGAAGGAGAAFRSRVAVAVPLPPHVHPTLPVYAAVQLSDVPEQDPVSSAPSAPSSDPAAASAPFRYV